MTTSCVLGQVAETSSVPGLLYSFHPFHFPGSLLMSVSQGLTMASIWTPSPGLSPPQHFPIL